jgi:2-hydroxy-6-oxonona-2,4-dienedioate hydrolase
MHVLRPVSRLIRWTVRSQEPSTAKLLTCVSVVTGAALSVWGWLRGRRERKRLLRAGAIRPLRSAWYRLEGLRLHARVSAGAVERGPDPVILIHGLGVSSTYFVPTAERLGSRFTVFAPDLPGHGRSDGMSFHPNVKELAEFALRWMSAAGISRATIVGHSMGCAIAIEMALTDPARISRLVLAAPTPDPRARTLGDQFGRLLQGVPHERPSLNLIVLKDYLRMGRRFIPEFYAMLRYPIERRLPLVRVPSIVVRGEKDPVVPQRWAEEAATLLANDRVLVIPGWGHAVQYSAAPQFVQAITPFLSADADRSTTATVSNTIERNTR